MAHPKSDPCPRVLALVRVLGISRIVYGLGLLVAPRAIAGHWLGAGATSTAALPPARSLGIRDAVIGAATLTTINNPKTCARVVAWGAAGDTVDALGTVIAHHDDQRVQRAYAVIAALAAVLSLGLASRLRQ
ncbi:hypothetical protein BOO86_05995 [Mycobacterium sp. CBMA 234]|uniref:hypothetical protein n=1 Tax=Mycolicibacterium sp. CBMA 234 TaxID=1918495 RepID=UPI0012DBFF60|nr:hypothetical protein [Mycolicibacterium sp. CBMA 234]MUL64010.1 hypothetical protein [Mycolicibacterium sp. CBMA 234]